LTGVAALLEEIKGLKFKAKKAAVFGCFGGIDPLRPIVLWAYPSRSERSGRCPKM
jgi:hypothetical protein